MMRDKTMDQTLQAKRVVEFELTKHNTRVSARRDDNSHFSDLGFKDKVINCIQFMSYSSVGYHRQNIMVERYVVKITTRGRIMLLHAKRFWLEAITNVI